jgi:uncharacterized membrane protein YozB (DUF420 family)
MPARSMKKTNAVLMILALVSSSIFLAWGILTGIAAQPGIFGTKASLFSDLNLIAQILLLLGLGVGAYFARKGNLSAHKYLQTGMVLFSIVLTCFIMIPAFVKYTLPEIPDNLPIDYNLVSTIHGVMGLVAIGCGVYLLLQMNALIPIGWRVSWWKSLMRLTFALYWLVGLLGLATYYLWYMR